MLWMCMLLYRKGSLQDSLMEPLGLRAEVNSQEATLESSCACGVELGYKMYLVYIQPRFGVGLVCMRYIKFTVV